MSGTEIPRAPGPSSFLGTAVTIEDQLDLTTSRSIGGLVIVENITDILHSHRQVQCTGCAHQRLARPQLLFKEGRG